MAAVTGSRASCASSCTFARAMPLGLGTPAAGGLASKGGRGLLVLLSRKMRCRVGPEDSGLDIEVLVSDVVDLGNGKLLDQEVLLEAVPRGEPEPVEAPPPSAPLHPASPSAPMASVPESVSLVPDMLEGQPGAEGEPSPFARFNPLFGSVGGSSFSRGLFPQRSRIQRMASSRAPMALNALPSMRHRPSLAGMAMGSLRSRASGLGSPNQGRGLVVCSSLASHTCILMEMGNGVSQCLDMYSCPSIAGVTGMAALLQHAWEEAQRQMCQWPSQSPTSILDHDWAANIAQKAVKDIAEEAAAQAVRRWAGVLDSVVEPIEGTNGMYQQVKVPVDGNQGVPDSPSLVKRSSRVEQ